MVESERRARRRAQKVAAYVDFLDASLVDGFLAKFERERLGEMADDLRLDADRLEHIHEAYFIALAVTAWADQEITFDEEAQLTMIAIALGIPTTRAIDLVFQARNIEPPLLLSGLGLTARDRITFADPLGTAAETWCERVASVGLSPTPDSALARYVVTSDPNLAGHTPLWEAGAMVVAEWAFEAAVTDLESRKRLRDRVL